MSNDATLGVWLEAPDKIRCCECETRSELSHIVGISTLYARLKHDGS